MKKGILPNEINNCSAGAGTLILEFGTLSRLTGDMRFEVLYFQNISILNKGKKYNKLYFELLFIYNR